MKYYASYTGVGEFSILSEIQYKEELSRLLSEASVNFNGDIEAELAELRFMIEFNGLTSAKRYILEGIQCDHDDLKIARFRLQNLKLNNKKMG